MLTDAVTWQKGWVDCSEGKLRRPGRSRLSATPPSSLHIFIQQHTLQIGPACVLLFSWWCGLSSSTLSLLCLHIWPAFPAASAICLRHKKLSSISWSEKLCGFADDLLSRGIQYISSSRTVLQTVWETQVRSSFWNRVLLRFSSLHPCVLNQREATHKNNHARSVVLYNLEQIQLGSVIMVANIYSRG